MFRYVYISIFLRSSFKEDDTYLVEIQFFKYVCRKSDDRKSVDPFHFRWDEPWNVCQGVIGPLAVFHFPSPLSLFRVPRAVLLFVCSLFDKYGDICTEKGKERKKWNAFSFSLFSRVLVPSISQSIAILPFVSSHLYSHSRILNFGF